MRKVLPIAILSILLFTMVSMIPVDGAASSDDVLVDFGNGQYQWYENKGGSTFISVLESSVDDPNIIKDIKTTKTTDCGWHCYQWDGRWVDKGIDLNTSCSGPIAFGYYPNGFAPVSTPEYPTSWTTLSGSSFLTNVSVSHGQKEPKMPVEWYNTYTPIDAENLTGFYPFNHVKLDDPHGSYYGYTKTNGEVMFDPFQRDDIRTRSFFFVTGNAGMGKSTLLKKMNDDVFARGAFIRNFDVSSEYSAQTKRQSGVVVDLARPEFMINPFEIFPTEINEDGSSNEISSFNRQITKLKNMLRFFNPEVNDDDLGVFEQWLNKFYVAQNVWVANAAKVQPDIKVTNLYLPKDAYPTLEDFVLFAKEQKRKATSDIRRRPTDMEQRSMVRIVNTFEGLLNNKRSMFEGYTKFPDLSNEQVVTFNLQSLNAQGKNVFNAQIYQVLTLLEGEIIKNGLRQRQLLQAGKITEDDAKWYYLNLDEVENLINPHFSYGVEFLASMMEQMRKNNCAITMAAPTIKDLIVNVSSDSPYIIAVQKIFSLFQINFFFQISNDDLPRLKVALGKSMSMAELQGLTTLRRGECLMNINGDRNIRFYVQLSDEEKKVYGGGM